MLITSLVLLCFYVLLYLANEFDGENAAEDARKYQSEGGVVRNSRNNQEHLLRSKMHTSALAHVCAVLHLGGVLGDCRRNPHDKNHRLW